MKRLCYLDTETRSEIDLKLTGVYRYVEGAHFQVLMAAYSWDGGPVQIALGHEEIAALYVPGARYVAHNAGFDRVALSKVDPRWLDPEQWDDTAARAAEYGLPRSLQGLSQALGAAPKDEAGTRLINLFSKPRKVDGGFNGPDTHPVEWAAFVRYCIQDVATMVECDQRMPGWPSAVERATWVLDQRINDRGMAIDVDLARAAQEASHLGAMRDRAEFTALTGVENPGSHPQVMAWVEAAGLPMKNLRAKTVEKVLARDDLDPLDRRVLELRGELALTSTSKFTAALASVCADGRVRGNFQFFGAHTGRFSGRGVQLQNLPRAAFADDAEVEAAMESLHAIGVAPPLTLKKLIRPMLTGPFTVVDLAQIEARVLAWLSGEDWVLEAFRQHRDLYVETAERMGGLTRQQGKVAVLALGYGGSVGALRQMGAEGDDDELRALVDLWRSANPRTVRFWKALGETFAEGGSAGRIRAQRQAATLKLRLPSDRAIHYYGTRFENYTVPDEDAEPDPETGEQPRIRKTSWRYADPAGRGGRIGLYGGRAAENVTQAVARDLLVEGMLRLERHGYTVLGHVHDEVILDGVHDVDTVSRILCELPDWAEGLPVDAEGFTTYRYKK